jgi:hypothetical protein
MNIDDSLERWNLASDLNIPGNEFTMTALQPVNIPCGNNKSLSGFVALYVMQGELLVLPVIQYYNVSD